MAPPEIAAVSAGTASLDAAVCRAVAVLRAGGVLAHPTDRVYGIGGASRADVDRAVSAMKGRELDRFPFLRIALEPEVLRRAYPGLVWPAGAERLAARLWPGPLTMVLADGSGGSLAVRVEGHPVTRAVLEAWGEPITSTSLNVSGEPPACTADEARRCLAGMADPGVPVLLLDAGDLAGPPPSTLVSFLGPTPAVLREGAIPRVEVRALLGDGTAP